MIIIMCFIILNVNVFYLYFFTAVIFMIVRIVVDKWYHNGSEYLSLQ